jgi:hypothetical protein
MPRTSWSDTKSKIRVIVKSWDATTDYWLPAARAKELFNKGKLSAASVYASEFTLFDPTRKYISERI